MLGNPSTCKWWSIILDENRVKPLVSCENKLSLSYTYQIS